MQRDLLSRCDLRTALMRCALALVLLATAVTAPAADSEADRGAVQPTTSAPFVNPFTAAGSAAEPTTEVRPAVADEAVPAEAPVTVEPAAEVPTALEAGLSADAAEQVNSVSLKAGAATESTPPAEATPPADAPADEVTPDVADAEPSSGPAPLESLGDTPSMPLGLPGGIGGPEQWLSPDGISSAIRMVALLAVVSLAPAILLMTTCFVRIAVVLGLLRQALGTQQLPPNQVMTSIALFMTLLIMSPVWTRVYHDAVEPYTAHEITLEEAWDAGVKPVRQFMSAQIDRTGNRNDVWLFYKYLPEGTPAPSSYDDVPLSVMLPAFMLSELKTAFLIGFQIYLPFLVLDLVVASVTISMGMLMLPPVLVSLPFKLLLFVLVDGWHLVVGMLLESFQTFS